MKDQFENKAISLSLRNGIPDTLENKPISLIYPKQKDKINVRGKFLFEGEKKFLIRGVTYGTFRPHEDGYDFPNKGVVQEDFKNMASCHINTVRLYTVPPIWLLDLASEYGLKIIVGLPWEQHITFLDNKEVIDSIKTKLRKDVRSCKNHPAVLCYTIGNEIPASIVRWYGPKKIERFLKMLYDLVKKEDPNVLVTYVNFPPTEYLQLPFLDLFCFNVYLEDQKTLDKYLARLQNLSDEKPLILAEIGLDSRRNGEYLQAETLLWQINTVFQKGAAGSIVFSWTDEWYRGGHDILDWDFGLTTRNRESKKALTSVDLAYSNEPYSLIQNPPFISVAVCSFNGAKTLKECLEALARLNYPDYEIVVVNDGSTDQTEEIAKSYPCRLITTPNRGLSNARNTAWQESKGDIVVYIDDDAYPDPDWLTYLAISFQNNKFAAVGGPNIPPLDSPLVAQGVAYAPGGPTHVLFSDEEAEHIPGCNMAFRKDVLQNIEGFDPLFRAAGDDVDICWRILEKGWKIGFSPSAVVWHHRRNKIRTYWKQQKGYGKAEALLETKWPQKFNHVGHLSWGGRLYTPGVILPLMYPRWKINFGTWGTGFFQSLYERDPHKALWIPLMPEWYALVGILTCIASIGFLWKPLLWVFPLAILTFAIAIIQAIHSTWNIHFKQEKSQSFIHKLQLRILICYLFLLQPLARLWGRLEFGLTMWRRRHKGSWAFPVTSHFQIWNEKWKSSEFWLTNLEDKLIHSGVIVKRGDAFDNWDLEVREGLSMPNRIIMSIEEHGEGKQFVRFRTWPKYGLINMGTVALFLALTLASLWSKAFIAASILGIITLMLGSVLLRHSLPIIKTCLEHMNAEVSTQE